MEKRQFVPREIRQAEKARRWYTARHGVDENQPVVETSQIEEGTIKTPSSPTIENRRPVAPIMNYNIRISFEPGKGVQYGPGSENSSGPKFTF